MHAIAASFPGNLLPSADLPRQTTADQVERPLPRPAGTNPKRREVVAQRMMLSLFILCRIASYLGPAAGRFVPGPRQKVAARSVPDVPGRGAPPAGCRDGGQRGAQGPALGAHRVTRRFLPAAGQSRPRPQTQARPTWREGADRVARGQQIDSRRAGQAWGRSLMPGTALRKAPRRWAGRPREGKRFTARRNRAPASGEP